MPGIHRCLVTFPRRQAHGAVTIVLGRVVVGILDECVTVFRVCKAPTRIVPHVFELAYTRHRLAVREICDWIIAADREPCFIAARAQSSQSDKQ